MAGGPARRWSGRGGGWEVGGGWAGSEVVRTRRRLGGGWRVGRLGGGQDEEEAGVGGGWAGSEVVRTRRRLGWVAGGPALRWSGRAGGWEVGGGWAGSEVVRTSRRVDGCGPAAARHRGVAPCRRRSAHGPWLMSVPPPAGKEARAAHTSWPSSTPPPCPRFLWDVWPSISSFVCSPS